MAEAKAQVSGTLVDSATGKPIERVVVGWWLNAPVKDTSYVFADEQGRFQLNPAPGATFTLYFSAVGYQPQVKVIKLVQPEKKIVLGNIRLAQRAILLGEVIVQIPPIVIKEDTIEYHADAFAVKENATAEDLLKKLPGVSVDKDGNVKAQGKDVTKIRVNGKDFFGGDVQAATRELPANIIEKVQIIDDYGEQSAISGIKDGEPSKIINLQIKKDKNKGLFGRLVVGGGSDERYTAALTGNYFNNQQQISVFTNSNNTNQSLFNFGGMGSNRGMGNMMKMGQQMMNDMGGVSGLTNAFQNGDQSFLSSGFNSGSGITQSSSVGINFRDQWGKRINVYGSYSFSHRSNEALTINSIQQFFKDSSYINSQNNNSKTLGNNHRLYWNVEYQMDSFNYLKVSPTFTLANSSGTSLSQFGYESQNFTTSDGSNNNNSTSDQPAFSVNLLFNHRFRKRGRNFSANINAGTSANDNDQETNNLTNLYIDPVSSFSLAQSINQNNTNQNYGIRLTYSEPLSATRSLDMAVSHNLNYARNDRKTYLVDPVTGNPVYNAQLSNDYENNFYNNRIGVSIRSTFKKYKYTLGVSAQPVSQRGKSLTKDSAYQPIDRFNFFPIARFSYQFSRSKTFNINYSGNATQPSYSQLQDVVDASNQQSITRGNPLLKPAVNHNINLAYNNFNIFSGKVMFLNLTFSTIQNQIVNNTIRLNGSGAQISMPENVDGYYNVLGFFTFSRPFQKRKYILTLTSTLNYNHNVNLVDSIKNIGHNWILSQGLTGEYNYKTWLQFGIGVRFNLNDVHYQVPDGKSISGLQNTNSSSWVFSSNINLDFKKNWVFIYDFDYTVNQGLNASVSQNLVLFHASLEKQFLEKKKAGIKLSVFDLFNQNTQVSRSVSANSIIDSRGNQLGRYLMLTFTYRLQKFQGQKPKLPTMGPGGAPANKNAEVKVF